MENTQNTQVSRRGFIASAAAATLATSVASTTVSAAESPKKFKLKYAPSLGTFGAHACEGRSKSAAGGGPKLRHPGPMYPVRSGVSIVSYSLFQSIFRPRFLG
ncbi:MAG TPA: hypothetical protein VLI39_09685, partial [Sedimentisphaerales bacterium]|nr:hypothetical protein [Sedimentisphaerales bacterium]